MSPAAETRFERVSAIYLVDQAVGAVHVGTQTMSMLVPVQEEELEEAFRIAQAKVLIAAHLDVGEEHICVVGVVLL
jgi:hypothetical protein